MARKMALPKIGVNMTEAVIAKWLVKVGDVINEGDAIIEAETDKSTQEIYATEGGVVAALLADEGQTVECYADILVLTDEGETYEPEAKTEAPKQEEKAAEETPVTSPVIAPVAAPAAAPIVSGARVRVSPLAKKIAKENGIDYHNVPPQTAGGRIVKKDVIAYLSNKPLVCAGSPAQRIKMSSIRKTIGARMTQSVLEKPSVGLVTTVDATAILALRAKYKQKGIKISFDALLSKIAAKALLQHPDINTTLEGDEFVIHSAANVGVAVDTDKGLMVPVIKNADKKSLCEISAELSELVEDAVDGRLSAQNMSDGTFTITNLGMFGVEEFAPIINPPQCCILGVGALKKEFVPDENDQPKLITTFKLTLVFDHRIVDGAPAARFLQKLKEFAQMPELLI